VISCDSLYKNNPNFITVGIVEIRKLNNSSVKDGESLLSLNNVISSVKAFLLMAMHYILTLNIPLKVQVV
jgi:hypothetical protein